LRKQESCCAYFASMLVCYFMKESAKQQFNVYLQPELIRKVKYRALDDQLSLSDLVERALEDYLRQSRRKTKQEEK